ncbi:P-loop ATPase [Candidatus Woesearchaeota archaeon]|nr:MAG: P-loop ATPase [Candidatus Woesearchaeota archaeon]
MIIAITGGKGGTGKSTIAVALATELAKDKNVLLVDADVDCPNDYLLLSVKKKKIKDVTSMLPKFDFDKCIKCGSCANVCREHAILFVKEKYPILVPEQCIGCKACMTVCPTGAILEEKQVIGYIYGSEKDNIKLVTGELKEGFEESSPIVNAVKTHIYNEKEKYDYVIIDTAAGTHCSVISALRDVDYAIAVTEPTPLGEHDLALILRLAKTLGIKTDVVINRATIANNKNSENVAKKFGVEIIARVPYSEEILRQYSKGEPIKHKSIETLAAKLK